MIGYKIRELNEKWYFEFIPKNNKNQHIGKSTYYSSEKECEEAVKNFHNLIKKEKISSVVSPFVKITQTNKGWQLEYILNNKTIFKSRDYVKKENCKKCILSISNQIDEYTSNKIDTDY